MLYQDKKGGENQWRKHHVSSVARDIWVYDTKTGKHTKLTTYEGEDRSPVFADNDKAIYYLSEASGTFNVHKMAAQGPAKPEQVTSFEKHPVRFLSAANDGTLCFSQNGELYTKKANGQAQKVNIRIATDAKTNNESILKVGNGIRDMAVSPNGKEVAFIYRGEVFVSAVEGLGDQAHHQHAGTGTQRKLFARRQVTALRQRARQELEDLQDRDRAFRGALLLRLYPAQGNSPGRERQRKLRSAVLAGR